LLELWSLAHFCNPGLLGGRKEFVARYARRIELGHALVASELQAKLRPFLLRRRKSDVAPELPPRTDIVLRCILDPEERAVYDGLRLATHAQVMERLSAGGTVIEALELLLRLRAKIRPFVLRRTKGDVLPDLPPRMDHVLHVALDDEERAVYDAVRIATKKDVAEKLAQGGGVLAALEALLRLRQAACHSQLVPGQTAESSSKIERLLESLEEAAADGHKALVFSQWTSLLDLVEPHLEAGGIRFTRLDGSTRDRGAVVSEFQSDDGPPVMLVSLKAGGTGLNLTAADHVFLVDPWWNPAVEDQAADRTHRIGQDKPVLVYRMVARDTVEERPGFCDVPGRRFARDESQKEAVDLTRRIFRCEE
jgi:SNF2 family DNA or RNA helicase